MATCFGRYAAIIRPY